MSLFSMASRDENNDTCFGREIRTFSCLGASSDGICDKDTLGNESLSEEIGNILERTCPEDQISAITIHWIEKAI